MNVRIIGVAVALLVSAAACRTSGTNSRGSGGTAQAPAPSDTSSTAQAPAPGSPGSSTTAQDPSASGPSASAGHDPLVEPGPPIKAHASDRIVSGEIGEVSDDSVTISSRLGDRKVLEVVPETTITIDGMDASSADLEEGQQVRAAYNEVDGRDVAVHIEAGEESSSPAQPKELGTPPSPAEPPAAGGSGSASDPLHGG